MCRPPELDPGKSAANGKMKRAASKQIDTAIDGDGGRDTPRSYI